MIQYYLTVLQKYATFSGRARRAEYWWFALANFIISVVLMIAGILIFGSTSNYADTFLAVYSLFVLLPSVAVTVRRLHDTGHSGWWYFISLVPLIGPIVILIFMCTDSEPNENKYGPPPKQYDYAVSASATI